MNCAPGSIGSQTAAPNTSGATSSCGRFRCTFLGTGIAHGRQAAPSRRTLFKPRATDPDPTLRQCQTAGSPAALGTPSMHAGQCRARKWHEREPVAGPVSSTCAISVAGRRSCYPAHVAAPRPYEIAQCRKSGRVPRHDGKRWQPQNRPVGPSRDTIAVWQRGHDGVVRPQAGRHCGLSR